MNVFAYILTLLSVSVYSYSQIDLNLTLSSNSIYQTFQNQLIQLGYFNRPLSTAIYIALLCLLFIFYFLILKLVLRKGFNFFNILWLIAASIVILFFAYPAFSHDIFNYMFDARIVTKYQTNPYFYKAADFPNDLWVRFMHWTHRTYPYGPVWLLVTLPFSFLGFGKFILTLVNFKLMFNIFYMGSIFMIYKILEKVSPKYTRLGITLFALNPLILIESLVSPHNEIVMLFFLLLFIYSGFIRKNTIWSIFFLLISIGIKFATAILLPYFLLYKLFKKKYNYMINLRVIFFLTLASTTFESLYREPYPWYFILLVGVSALLPESKKLQIIVMGISIGSLLRYGPYLYQGGYPLSVVFWQTWVFAACVGFVTFWVTIELIRERLLLKKE